MSVKYTRLGQLEGKFGVPAREYFTARDFGGNFTSESRSMSVYVSWSPRRIQGSPRLAAPLKFEHWNILYGQPIIFWPPIMVILTIFCGGQLVYIYLH